MFVSAANRVVLLPPGSGNRRPDPHFSGSRAQRAYHGAVCDDDFRVALQARLVLAVEFAGSRSRREQLSDPGAVLLIKTPTLCIRVELVELHDHGRKRSQPAEIGILHDDIEKLAVGDATAQTFVVATLSVEQRTVEIDQCLAQGVERDVDHMLRISTGRKGV